MTNWKNQRIGKKDTYGDDCSECLEKKRHRKRKNESCDTEESKSCDNINICDKLCLPPPKDACEKTNVTHCFKVTLGECKVTRDVKVTHCITANLNHHIKENIICNHEPCTKYTSDVIHKVDDGKCCDVEFPDHDDEIEFVGKSKNKHKINEKTYPSSFKMNYKKKCCKKHSH
jgi:hypothetical protein